MIVEGGPEAHPQALPSGSQRSQDPRRHRTIRIVFVELITRTAPGGRSSGDAWNAALKVGLRVMKEKVGASAP